MEASEQSDGRTLLVQDITGRYYAIPAAVVEQYRVPEEREEEVRGLLEGGDDVAGYTIGGPQTELVDPGWAIAAALKAVWLSFSLPFGPSVSVDLSKAVDMAPTGPSMADHLWNSPSPREQASGPTGSSSA